MDFILNLTYKSIEQVWVTLLHNWPYLLISVVIAVLLKLYVDAQKVTAFINRFRGAGVFAATTAAVATPLCSCGTTAVVLGMMASMMPWAPIVAFMVSSPLTSPQELVYSAGLFGWPFALAFFLSSIVLGLAGGWIASIFERQGWLANQTRFAAPVAKSCECSEASQKQPFTPRVYGMDVPSIQLINSQPGCGYVQSVSSCGCGAPEGSCGCDEPVTGYACDQARPVQAFDKIKKVIPIAGITEFLNEMVDSGKRLLVMFVGFAFIGYFLNGLIPSSWVTAIFGSGNTYSVPLAATLGLPFYINTEASLPLVRALLDAGMSQGAVLAFMISGAGTSIGAIAGAMTIARWRVIALVIGVLWGGAILLGYTYNLVLAMGLF